MEYNAGFINYVLGKHVGKLGLIIKKLHVL